MKIQKFFPTGVLFHQVSKDIADKVEELILPRLNKFIPNANFLQSDFYTEDKIINLDEISFLYEEILECVKYYERETGFSESKYAEHWVQDYTQDRFHDTHNHGRNQLSVVYWVRANNEAGSIQLFDPKPQQFIFHGNLPNPSEYTTYKITIPPIKGGILIFPGYLNHRVLPGGANCIRTTIAFNFLPIKL